MAAKATPNIPKRVIPTNTVIANRITGTIVDKYPRASPKITFNAAPYSHAKAISLTG